MDDYCLMNRIAWDKVIQSKIFKTLYKSSDGTYTESKELGYWYHWNGKPDGALCCDIKYLEYFIVNDIIYYDIHKARDAMMDFIFGD